MTGVGVGVGVGGFGLGAGAGLLWIFACLLVGLTLFGMISPPQW